MSQAPRELYPGRSARDLFGAELRYWRCLRRLSQADLAEGTHFSSDLISKVEKAERWPQRDLTDACDAALDTGGALARILPWVDTEHRNALAHAAHADIAPTGAGFGSRMVGLAGSLAPAHGFLPHTGRITRAGGRTRRGGTRGPAAPVPAAADGGPLTLEAYVAMTAHESAWFFDHPSNVGPATLDQLRSDATRLARMSIGNTPRIQVFTHARWLRDHVFGLLDGRQRVTEARELYFVAGATCGMLANITEDLGYHNEAMTHARTGLLCADQSGHAGLRAWILCLQAMISYFDGRPRHAAEYARRGQEGAPAGTVGVWLAAQEARATARLGNAGATRTALIHAAAAREQVTSNELDEMGGLMAFGSPKQHYYGAEAYLCIGDHSAVVTEANACVDGYRAGPVEERSRINEVLTQVNLSQALVADDMEAARDAAQPAFGIVPELRTDALSQGFRLLHGRLCAPTVRTAPVAIDLRTQIEHFLAADTLSPD
ncbi:MAG TPA: helix-turn-helix transcriptional regulator [Mycobacteriales bacterium]|nr:helix-turn-helix transcriptional regulator [Mycobacteriales bacterium]